MLVAGVWARECGTSHENTAEDIILPLISYMSLFFFCLFGISALFTTYLLFSLILFPYLSFRLGQWGEWGGEQKGISWIGQMVLMVWLSYSCCRF